MSLVLSSSSVSAYLDCELRYYYGYILNIEGERSDAIATGIAVHHAAEQINRANLMGLPLDEREAIGAFRSSIYEQKMTDIDLSAGEALTKLYLHEVAPTFIPVWVEEGYAIEVNGIRYGSIWDVSDADGNVRDIKTTKRRPRPSEYAFAMVGHALGFRVVTGFIENDIILDYLVRTPKAHKTYYYPIRNGGPATDGDIRSFASILNGIGNGIENRRFRPTGLEYGSCRWCPYQKMCQPYQEYGGRQNDDNDEPASETG